MKQPFSVSTFSVNTEVRSSAGSDDEEMPWRF